LSAAVFIVPTTHDMVSQLLDPRQPKNLSDAVVLVILGLHILLAYLLPAELKKPVMAAVFIFWRASYNVGIGVLLNEQSNGKLMVTWAKRWRLFVNPSTGKQPRPWLYSLLKRELEAKIPEDYKFEDAPLEYNTWLVFRRLVDLILMCDFVSYCLFAVVCAHVPEGEITLVLLCRWAVGVALLAFNVWVKLDAHRVVKDFAWYWGDFFYLVDQELTFDGVFEMAPHPMYSSKHSPAPAPPSALPRARPVPASFCTPVRYFRSFPAASALG
jgi:phosphatidylethanolamine N-methyltransferase